MMWRGGTGCRIQLRLETGGLSRFIPIHAGKNLEDRQYAFSARHIGNMHDLAGLEEFEGALDLGYERQ
jgi:hypothetical protein